MPADACLSLTDTESPPPRHKSSLADACLSLVDTNLDQLMHVPALQAHVLSLADTCLSFADACQGDDISTIGEPFAHCTSLERSTCM